MKEEILNNINSPKELEQIYRNNKSSFKKNFNELSPILESTSLVQFWNERLNYETSQVSWGKKNELTFIIIASLLSGLIAKIPMIFSFDADFFYPRNMGFIVFPILTIYFAWKNNSSSKTLLYLSIATIVPMLFINLLPENDNSDTLILACIHLPLFLWAVLGFTFIGDKYSNYDRRLDFLRFNGDLAVITILILIGGMILTGITIGLFSLIGFEIFDFYFEYIVILGLASSPIVGTYIVQTNPQLVDKVSPIIAKIFSPLVLITLVVYLSAIIISGKDPYNDREFLLTFNFLLIGVMAIILFSIAEKTKTKGNRIGLLILILLSILTILINGIALSAILFRIAEWGITPNRLAVLGSNLLILSNLLIVLIRLIKSYNRKIDIKLVEEAIAKFLPIYSIWTIIVIFIFPIIFKLN